MELSMEEFAAVRIRLMDDILTKPMESLSRDVYEKAPSEMAKELAKIKCKAFNQILRNRGELARIIDKAAREEEKPYPSVEKAIKLYIQETNRLCGNVMTVISKMSAEIDGRSKEEKAKQEEIPDLWRMKKTSAQKAADLKIHSIDKRLTKSMEKVTRKLCEKAPVDIAKEMSDMKITTFNQILIKRAEVTRAVDKALGEGNSVEDAIDGYEREARALCKKFVDIGKDMWAEIEEERFQWLLDHLEEMSEQMRNDFEIMDQYSDNYKETGRVETEKTREKVEKLLEEDPEADVEPIVLEFQQFMFELREIAVKTNMGVPVVEKKEGKRGCDQVTVEEYEKKEEVMVEEAAEKEEIREKKADKKKEEVTVEKEAEKKEKTEVEKNRDTVEKVLSKDELKKMMTVMKEEIVQEFNKKFKSAQENHKKEIEKVQKDYCRLEAERNEEVKKLTVVVESLNKKLEAMTLEMAEKQKETEDELKGVKRELKEAREELERMQEDSGEDSSFDQLDDQDE
uniref:Trichohyalin-like n=1 Tax=Caenorhabditis tropicalis TaxID=1561998 RepID=A0A1I7UHD4_9PELO